MSRSRENRPAQRLRIVLYHHLSDDPSSLVDRLGISTAPRRFAEHLDYFQKNYHIVDLGTVLSGDLPPKPLLLTFDDGYRSVLDVAGPMLAARGLPSVLFVSAGMIHDLPCPLDNLLCLLSHQVSLADLERAITGVQPGCDEFSQLLGNVVPNLTYQQRLALPEGLAQAFDLDLEAIASTASTGPTRSTGSSVSSDELFMGPDDLPRLAEFGIELGNHTQDHLHCRAITDQAAASCQLIEHKQRLEAWSGQSVRSFSYPYGRRDDATPFVQSRLSESGHQALFLVEARTNRPSHAGPTWYRVSLQNQAVNQLYKRIEILPALRLWKDRLLAKANSP